MQEARWEENLLYSLIIFMPEKKRQDGLSLKGNTICLINRKLNLKPCVYLERHPLINTSVSTAQPNKRMQRRPRSEFLMFQSPPLAAPLMLDVRRLKLCSLSYLLEGFKGAK